MTLESPRYNDLIVTMTTSPWNNDVIEIALRHSYVIFLITLYLYIGHHIVDMTHLSQYVLITLL